MSSQKSLAPIEPSQIEVKTECVYCKLHLKLSCTYLGIAYKAVWSVMINVPNYVYLLITIHYYAYIWVTI